MPFTKLKDRLNDLPLILVGPIIRRTELDYVSVFVVLQKQKRITLRVFGEANANSRVAALTGTTQTIKLFENVHIAVVSARASVGEELEPDKLYYYDMLFDDTDGGSPRNNQPEVDDNPSNKGLQEPGILNKDPSNPERVVHYNNDIKLPSFISPPSSLENLRLVHGSCRKPHNEGFDALSALDELIKDDTKRPHQLMLTGDQIYADDVSDLLLFLIRDACEGLASNVDKYAGLPQTGKLAEVLNNALPSTRQKLTEEYCGFTSEEAKSHLLSIPEYCLMYLFVWSEVLWPEDWPSFDEVYEGTGEQEVEFKTKGRGTDGGLDVPCRTATSRSFLNDCASLKNFKTTLSNVSKALANVPTYMIWDDHEVTDDWFLNRSWIKQVMRSELGRFVLRSAYLAFGMFQGWGNFRLDSLDSKYADFIDAVAGWANNNFTEDQNDMAAKMVSYCVGLPYTEDDVKQFIEDLKKTKELRKGNDSIREWHAKGVEWHFRIDFKGFELVALDTRTWRRFPVDMPDISDNVEAKDFPALIGEGGLSAQLSGDNAKPYLICLNPAPFLGAGDGLIESWQRFTHSTHNDPEAWSLQSLGFERLLARIAQRGTERVVMLSGDVHYSYAARLRYWCDGTAFQETSAKKLNMTCAQLTTSSFRQSALKTKFLQWFGYPAGIFFGLPNAIERIAWNKKDQAEVIGTYELSAKLIDWTVGGKDLPLVAELNDYKQFFMRQLRSVIDKPDWRYRIDWLESIIPKPSSPPVQTTNSEAKPDPSTKKRGLKAYHKTAIAQRVEAEAEEGKEIIGRNTLALVQFGKNSVSQSYDVVRQTNYWQDDTSGPIMDREAVFEVPLEDIANYPRPTVDGDPSN